MSDARTILLPATEREPVIERVGKILLSAFSGQKVELVIRRYRKSRSNQQNRALWGVAYKALQEQTGNDPEDLHVYFCGEFFGWTDYDVMGMKRRKPARTTTTDTNGNRAVMPTVEFSAFYEFIQRRSAESGFNVPSPNEECT